VHKEILRQRGVIRTSNVRGPVTPLDEMTRRELQQVIDELYGSSKGVSYEDR
jgi:dihydrodipicolinate synthase/N-acetylneuraminate lyase